VRRLLLVRHAPTSATRQAAFPGDEPVDAVPPGSLAAVSAALAVEAEAEAISSPALRCRQTAGALGLHPRCEPRIAECDFGDWAGRSLSQVDTVAAGQWMTDPDARPHGGESLTDFAGRVAGWLDAQAADDGCTVAITHAGVIKAAVVHTLGAPVMACWRIAIAPLSVTELTAHDGAWMLQQIGPRG
jgi:broad specificity phosphatase PhoE